MASLSAKDENFVRLALLLTGLSPRAVRVFFDKEFPPTHLPSTLNTNYNTLYDLKSKRVLNQAQWILLFPKKGVPNSNTFDITLMICIIRNLTSINPPINGFDELPLPMETTPGSDLARIKWYRNILAHYDSTTMSIGDFNTAWRNIAEAVSRLGCLSMNQECQELKVIILDQSQKEIKELRQTMTMEHSTMRKNLSDLQNSYSTLQTEHSKLTEIFLDPVPWNIRDQINEELENWKENDKTFIETNGAKSVLNRIKENGCVVVTSSPGNGKTSLVRHVAIQMQNEGYEILPVSNPTEILAWYNPSKEILFVADDFCGTYRINQTKIDNWYNLKEKIKELVEKKPVKLIMSCRLQVYQDIHMKSLSFFQSCECNLLSADLCLSKTEKQSIAEFYLKTNASKIITLYDKFDCFPLLCKLYNKNPKLNIVDFFTNPFTVYKEEIGKLQRKAPDKYCAFALCAVFNDYLKENWLTEDIDKEIKKIIKNTYEACKVVKGTSRFVLRDELDSLTHTFIRKDGEMYRTIHDKLIDLLAFYFGSEIIYCLINKRKDVSPVRDISYADGIKDKKSGLKLDLGHCTNGFTVGSHTTVIQENKTIVNDGTTQTLLTDKRTIERTFCLDVDDGNDEEVDDPMGSTLKKVDRLHTGDESQEPLTPSEQEKMIEKLVRRLNRIADDCFQCMVARETLPLQGATAGPLMSSASQGRMLAKDLVDELRKEGDRLSREWDYRSLCTIGCLTVF